MKGITDDKILNSYYDNGEVFVVDFDPTKVYADISGYYEGTIRFVLKRGGK